MYGCIAQMVKRSEDSSIMLNGKSVTFIHQHKYLGIILNEDMFDGPDMIQHVKVTYTGGNVLISRFMKCNEAVKFLENYCMSKTERLLAW